MANYVYDREVPESYVMFALSGFLFVLSGLSVVLCLLVSAEWVILTLILLAGSFVLIGMGVYSLGDRRSYYLPRKLKKPMGRHVRKMEKKIREEAYIADLEKELGMK